MGLCWSVVHQAWFFSACMGTMVKPVSCLIVRWMMCKVFFSILLLVDDKVSFV